MRDSPTPASGNGGGVVSCTLETVSVPLQLLNDVSLGEVGKAAAFEAAGKAAKPPSSAVITFPGCWNGLEVRVEGAGA